MWERFKNTKQSTRVIILAGIVLVFVILIATGGANDSAETEEVSKNTEVQESERDDEVEDNEDTEGNEIENIINDRVTKYGAQVKDIRINEDANNEGEYLVLIDFTALHKDDTEKMYDDLKMWSDDIAANLAEVDEVNTVVAFWGFSNKQINGNALKRAYNKQDDGKMYLDDEVKNIDIFN